MLVKIIDKIISLVSRLNSNLYISYLRKKGCYIGENTYIYSKNALIDISRPTLVSIGANCYINQYFTLLTHDWVCKVFLNMGKPFLNSSGKVTIGNNVSFGMHVTVLKGVTIGDNCFIAAGSVVTKDIPAGSVAGGVPCRVLTTIDEYFKKRMSEAEEEAKEYIHSLKHPKLLDMKEEFIWFISGSELGSYPQLNNIIKKQLGEGYESYAKYHKAKYSSFEDFVRSANR